MRRTAIFGPPGTGKTTKLMDIVEKEFSKGVLPSKLAFVSFTNAAVNEAKKRMREKFGLKKDDLYWFKTIHSLCFNLTKRPGQRVVKPSDLMVFAKTNRIANFSGNSRRKQRGDIALEAYHLSRAADMSLKEAWMNCTNWMTHDFSSVEEFVHKYEQWKENCGMIDFQDMLDNYIKHPVSPDIDVSIVDEVQDLSAQQWAIIEETFKKSKRQYIAGDDDQSIYAWSGSRVDKMLNYPADEKIVLHQSYRCPKAVHSVANLISSRIKKREKKEWKPTKKQGQYKAYGDFSFVPFTSYPDESWFVLARADFLLDNIRWWLRSLGMVFTDEKGYSINQRTAHKIMTLDKLKNGETCSAKAVRSAVWGSLLNYNVIDLVHLPTQGEVDLKTVGIDLENKNPVALFRHLFRDEEEYEYYLRTYAIKKDLMIKPNIELSTIHKAKGREADNVVVLLDQTTTVIESAMLDADNEHRNWYVAVTRAKKRLYTIVGNSVHNYEL